MLISIVSNKISINLTWKLSYQASLHVPLPPPCPPIYPLREPYLYLLAPSSSSLQELPSSFWRPWLRAGDQEGTRDFEKGAQNKPLVNFDFTLQKLGDE
jgi:hypothetical protein